MKINKETTYKIELDKKEMERFIAEMNTIYPLFASEGDVEDIQFLLNLKDELAMSCGE